ncbi:MAG: fimbrillin family protein [Prevotellaceae bacterium]|nr:fimbrillin family protein [Candidatus Minthosoma caballi]
MALASCSDEVVDTTDYLNGKEKTPIAVTALMDASNNAKQTRAVDMEFEKDDKLIAYLRHITWDGTTNGTRESVTADHAPQLVTFTKGSTAMTAYSGDEIYPIGINPTTLNENGVGLTSSNTQQTEDLIASPTLYWDDFSNSATDATDLRTVDHYLESYYGYCYNGGTPTTALTEATGVLGWTVATNQSTGFKTSDLLWSYEQTPVAYSHAAGRDGLVIPYTHAMSKVTIEVVCEDGFDSNATKNFGSATVTLNQMNTVTSLTAPTATATVGTTPADIQMQKGTPEAKKCSFSAIIAPTLFKAGNDLATITGVDGNKYTIPLTDAVLTTATTPAKAWSTQLAAAKVDDAAATSVTAYAASGYTATDGGITKPGVNYLITVTINKQEITVQAIIKNWDEVSATGVGVIQFANDFTDKTGEIAAELQDNGFDLYKSANTDPAVYGMTATTYTYDKDADPKWTRNNEIYWPNATDKFFFRALSGATPDDENTDDKNESLSMENGKDVLWGTTSAHKGPQAIEPFTVTYDEGAAIAPRTGDVPLTFYHPMAKITINLEDENKSATVEGWEVNDVKYLDYSNPLNPRINLAGAKVQITNMAKGGTIDLHTGNITPDDVSEKMLGDDTGNNPYKLNGTENTITTDWLNGYVVTPQDIADNAMLIVTLADGTTYKTQLNTCTVTATTTGTATLHPVNDVISRWNRGVSYTYTIIISREKISFRALIENWDKIEGGGKATLEWD